ncbi:MAG: replication initiator protein A [Pseudomonadota bacterium]
MSGALSRGASSGSLSPAPASPVFVCDLFDVAPKDDLASMEHPIFSLATRPDRSILSYVHNGVEVEVTPSVKGRATIHDKDILIYCISQLMAALNAGREVSRVLHLRAHDLLVGTGRDTSGDAYRRLREAFERLAGTRITTNIAIGAFETTSGFGLIESWEIVRRSRGGRMVQVVVTLSEWLFRAVEARAVLTLAPGYFDLRRPLERRIYELCRKHCGRQPEWRVSLATLQKKSGSASPRRVFRAMLRDIISRGRLPEYDLALEEGDVLAVTPRRAPAPADAPRPSESALEEARAMLPGADVHALVAQWQGWWARSGRARIGNADKAFLGWCRTRRG